MSRESTQEGRRQLVGRVGLGSWGASCKFRGSHSPGSGWGWGPGGLAGQGSISSSVPENCKQAGWNTFFIEER